MNGKWTKENFEEYHKDNPEIWELFRHYALLAANKRPRYSARGIFHQIRWHTMMQEKDGEYKIDAGWTSHYARKFMDDCPEYGDFFETRVRRNSYHSGQVNISETGKLL